MHGSSSSKWAIIRLFPLNSYSGRSLSFPPAQSSFQISLSTAKLRSTERGTHFATFPHEVWWLVCYWGVLSRHTRFLCILHDRYFVRKALDSFQRKNQYIGPLPHPFPTLPCMVVRLAKYDYIRSRLTTQIV